MQVWLATNYYWTAQTHLSKQVTASIERLVRPLQLALSTFNDTRLLVCLSNLILQPATSIGRLIYISQYNSPTFNKRWKAGLSFRLWFLNQQREPVGYFVFNSLIPQPAANTHGLVWRSQDLYLNQWWAPELVYAFNQPAANAGSWFVFHSLIL